MWICSAAFLEWARLSEGDRMCESWFTVQSWFTIESKKSSVRWKSFNSGTDHGRLPTFRRANYALTVSPTFAE
jgi:hypothetical protein